MLQENLIINQETSSKKEGIIEKFEKERSEWTEIISSIASRFKKVEDLVDVQVDLYSKRQIVVEYIHQMMVLQIRMKKSWLVEWKKVYDWLENNSEIRYGEKERTKYADEKTSELKTKMEIVQSQIDSFRETLKTIDSMIFGVKHRIEIENFRQGIK